VASLKANPRGTFFRSLRNRRPVWSALRKALRRLGCASGHIQF
jgi:hypothetical protein